MAWERIRGTIARLRESLPETVDQVRQAAAATSDPRAPGESAPRWVDSFLQPAPVAMLVVGALLAAFTELIGPWAILGYLLLAVAPILYWLQRIESRLVELRRELRNRPPPR